MPFASYEEIKRVGDPTIKRGPYYPYLTKEMYDWSRRYGLLSKQCANFDMVSGQCATAGQLPKGETMDWDFEASRCGDPEKAKQGLEEIDRKAAERGRLVGAARNDDSKIAELEKTIAEREKTNLDEVKREYGFGGKAEPEDADEVLAQRQADLESQINARLKAGTFAVDVEEGDASKGCDRECKCSTTTEGGLPAGSCYELTGKEKPPTADQLWLKVNGRFGDVSVLRQVKERLKEIQRERGGRSVLSADGTEPISRVARQIMLEALEATLTEDAWNEVLRQARLIVDLRITRNSTELRTVVDEFIAG